MPRAAWPIFSGSQRFSVKLADMVATRASSIYPITINTFATWLKLASKNRRLTEIV